MDSRQVLEVAKISLGGKEEGFMGKWRFEGLLPACPDLSMRLHASAHLSLSHHPEIDSPTLLISSLVTAARRKETQQDTVR